ncbi:hypothetical protein CRG98_048040 [Punica granatum]|uniref:Uncharacterized protein n=1 Tax=Punica granatum TaxID=22663 RepID=A0A2I0HJQ6_PUNGR|nr:hypothetical protein CRG98_048040 [Punica granatum]
MECFYGLGFSVGQLVLGWAFQLDFCTGGLGRPYESYGAQLCSSSNAHELSAEEADEIQRSTTKVKEWTPNTESPASPAVSYEDRLTGTFPGSMAGAYEEAFCIDHAYEDDTDDDIGPEDDDENSQPLEAIRGP